jgi:hypothetical protein
MQRVDSAELSALADVQQPIGHLVRHFKFETLRDKAEVGVFAQQIDDDRSHASMSPMALNGTDSPSARPPTCLRLNAPNSELLIDGLCREDASVVRH